VEATAESYGRQWAGNASRSTVRSFSISHEIAKLIGSPPGYLGHRETSSFAQPGGSEPLSHGCLQSQLPPVDEIEKASDALWNLLLGILDKATLTLGDNRRVDSLQDAIFMTSNLGASEMTSILSPRLGFNAINRADCNKPAVLDQNLQDKITRSRSGCSTS